MCAEPKSRRNFTSLLQRRSTQCSLVATLKTTFLAVRLEWSERVEDHHDDDDDKE